MRSCSSLAIDCINSEALRAVFANLLISSRTSSIRAATAMTQILTHTLRFSTLEAGMAVLRGIPSHATEQFRMIAEGNDHAAIPKLVCSEVRHSSGMRSAAPHHGYDDIDHSFRSATMGSTPAARRAGTSDASSAAKASVRT